MEKFIIPIYMTPIVIAFLWRLEWWIFHSPKNAEFLPDHSQSDAEIALLALIFWPLTLLCVAIILAIAAICWPFWAITQKLRKIRLGRNP